MQITVKGHCFKVEVLNICSCRHGQYTKCTTFSYKDICLNAFVSIVIYNIMAS